MAAWVDGRPRDMLSCSATCSSARWRKSPVVPAVKGQPNPALPFSAQPKVDAERLVRRFLPKAFRRPVPEEIAASYVGRVIKATSQ